MIYDNTRSMSFIDLCLRSLRFNIFKLLFLKKNTGPFEAKFHRMPPWDVGIKMHSNFPVHMSKMASRSIYGKTLKMTVKLVIQHRALKYNHICSMTLCWPWPFLWHGQICFLILLHGWKLIQHIVMYFQACSNSAYPMHSCERYRTNGPLVWLIFLLLQF